MDPRMSYRHSRQSNETDSVKRATSAAGPASNRPLRQTGGVSFIAFNAAECASKNSECHWKMTWPQVDCANSKKVTLKGELIGLKSSADFRSAASRISQSAGFVERCVAGAG